ncbi:proteasome maturation ans ribosome synthesis protein Nop10 [Trichodelitschia bisporula]|uniref:20S-pre-rRNA D-site endonuclease NOB1 n=1 Tax=Trichodelitschia bisporula TaxID=703511 RepID=A0A6G1I538_9PEZI|nr:proteasome maturation ans ribosome synthesis protein Nop10 [Trichodelitschia bisporula]
MEKPIHTVVLDAGPIIRGEPSVSSLLQQCENIISTPAVIEEIRDEAARSRLQTTLLPFLTLKTPNPNSIKVISDFARKTGDLAVLSRTDIQLLALSYETECERNCGDWRLRSVPGQQRTNGPPPPAITGQKPKAIEPDVHDSIEASEQHPVTEKSDSQPLSKENEGHDVSQEDDISSTPANEPEQRESEAQDSEPAANNLQPEHPEQEDHDSQPTETISSQLEVVQLSEADGHGDSEESDPEGWITPSNIKKKQAKDAAAASSNQPLPKTMQVATITTDFAMQNVLLQMNLNLISGSLQRVQFVKSFVLRCHACFNIVRDMSKQFCPRCGKPSLTRVSCSTSQSGEFKLHLKKNMQWNKKGDRYSIPKPVAGSASGRVMGGGKEGWGNELILAEDQKEYVRAMEQQKRLKQRDLMDEDYLPGILTGDRAKTGGKLKVGAGRNVNSRRR